MSNAKAAGPLVGVLRDLLLREIVKRQASPRGQAIPVLAVRSPHRLGLARRAGNPDGLTRLAAAFLFREPEHAQVSVATASRSVGPKKTLATAAPISQRKGGGAWTSNHSWFTCRSLSTSGSN
jgi:hypothetical protein